MPPSDIDCTTCGACCFGGHDRYVAILPEDRARTVPEAVTREVEGRRYMQMCGGRCAQLRRTEDARLVCAIYEHRPEACRAFRAGSFECLRARRHRGAEADRLRLQTNPSPWSPVVPDPLKGCGGQPAPRSDGEVIPSP